MIVKLICIAQLPGSKPTKSEGACNPRIKLPRVIPSVIGPCVEHAMLSMSIAAVKYALAMCSIKIKFWGRKSSDIL